MSFTDLRYPIPTHPTWDVIDPSKLQCFLDCERQYFYQYVLGWRQDRMDNHLHFGTSWHKAMEFLLRNGYDQNSIMGAYLAFEREYRKVFPKDTDYLMNQKTPANALMALVEYAAKYRADLTNYEVLYTEVGGTAPLYEDLVLHYRIDSILRERNTGLIISLEHKTASSEYMWDLQWPLSIQVNTYTHALYCFFPPEQVKGVVINGAVFKKTKAPTFAFPRAPVYKRPEQLQGWLQHTQLRAKQLQTEFEILSGSSDSDPVLDAFPLRPVSCTKFFGCPYHAFCVAWQNPLQHCESVPLGFVQEWWDPRRDEVSTKVENGKLVEVTHEERS
jgi:hypothetical protein